MGALDTRTPEMVWEVLRENPQAARIDWLCEDDAEPPCIRAVRSRCEPEVHRLLLRHKADPNAEDDDHTTALSTFSASRSRKCDRSWDQVPLDPFPSQHAAVLVTLPWLTSPPSNPPDVSSFFASLLDADDDKLGFDGNPLWSVPGAAGEMSSTVHSQKSLAPKLSAEIHVGREHELAVASVLLAAGANPFHESRLGCTPVSMAKADGQKELARLLQFYGDVQALRAVVYAVNRPAHVNQLLAVEDASKAVFSFLLPKECIPRLFREGSSASSSG
jgi:hypothetical protein